MKLDKKQKKEYEETTQEKLERFERYIRRTRFSYSGAKSNMLFRFHEIFLEEMEGTETGTKFRKKCGIEK